MRSIRERYPRYPADRAALARIPEAPTGSGYSMYALEYMVLLRGVEPPTY